MGKDCSPGADIGVLAMFVGELAAAASGFIAAPDEVLILARRRFRPG